MERTGMTIHEFSKRSGILRSTLWSLAKKEDYDIRESNIRKIAEGMGVPPSVLFDDADSNFCLNERSEIQIIKEFHFFTFSADKLDKNVETYALPN
jgi:transcriptional regulator with XRE-family HTH domain